MNAKARRPGSVRQCHECGHLKSTVVNSRDGSGELMRRRECLKCRHRWSTIEVMKPEAVSLASQRAVTQAIVALNAAAEAVSQAQEVIAAFEKPPIVTDGAAFGPPADEAAAIHDER